MISRKLRGRFRPKRKRTGLQAAVSAVRSLIDAASRTKLKPRNPYVQNVSETSAVLAWVSDEPNVGVVEYGETPQLGLKGVDARVGRRHAVALSSLVPGSTYYYRVREVGGGTASGRFRTAPATGSGAPFAFAVIGDSGDGGKGQLAVAKLLGELEPDLLLHTGDVVYPGGADRHYDRRFFEPYGLLIREVPFFPTPGNHDLEVANGAAYLKNFHLPRNNPRSTARYYSFDWGCAHFTALNSELYHDDRSGTPEEQKVWLEKDLAKTRATWKVAYLHRPPYSSSEHGSDEEIREDLSPVFARHGVDLVFSGHDHAYERTVPISGVTYMVSGGGGKDLYEAPGCSWTAASRSAHHAVLVRVDGESLALEAVEPGGTVFDRFVRVRDERAEDREAVG